MFLYRCSLSEWSGIYGFRLVIFSIEKTSKDLNSFCITEPIDGGIIELLALLNSKSVALTAYDCMRQNTAKLLFPQTTGTLKGAVLCDTPALQEAESGLKQ